MSRTEEGNTTRTEEDCRLCLGSGRIAVGPWGGCPPKKQCPECHGRRRLPVDHQYQDPTV